MYICVSHVIIFYWFLGTPQSEPSVKWNILRAGISGPLRKIEMMLNDALHRIILNIVAYGDGEDY